MEHKHYLKITGDERQSDTMKMDNMNHMNIRNTSSAIFH